MRYYLDTEFIERGRKYPIELISIGIVAEDGREFYAISNEFDSTDIDPWIQMNVLITLETDIERISCHEIATRVLQFIGDASKPEFWAYYADYDWVVFCQLFGRMVDLPKHFPMYCNDLKQLYNLIPEAKFPMQRGKPHNALDDARWDKLAHDTFLARLQNLTILTRPLFSELS